MLRVRRQGLEAAKCAVVDRSQPAFSTQARQPSAHSWIACHASRTAKDSAVVTIADSDSTAFRISVIVAMSAAM